MAFPVFPNNMQETLREMDTVYVLTNPAMPGLVKIGFTSQDDAKCRIDQLYTTGVPVPYEIAYACRIENAAELEKAFHTAFAPHRINPKREFFRIDPEQVISILRVLPKQDTTSELTAEPSALIDPESAAAGEQLRKRRPNMNFQEMGLPIGAELYFTEGDGKVVVVGPKKVKLGDEELSLTAATRRISGLDYDPPAALFWTYDGRLLRSIYEEHYASPE
jgi:hypothetical protein